MPFPPAHLLLGAGAAELARIPVVPGSRRLPAWRVWLAGAFFGVLPDLDTAVMLLHGADAPNHGLYTHNLVALAGVTLVVGSFAGWRWAAVAGAAYTSHLLADLLREGTSTSVYLFWPLSREPLSPLAPLFPSIPFDRPGGELTLYGPDPLGMLVRQTLIAAGFFAVALLVGSGARSVGRRGSPPPVRPARIILPPPKRGSGGRRDENERRSARPGRRRRPGTGG